ncbi:MAG: glycosyltransferase family 4 protein [Coriobacteriia bacterium]|nr:glycosyltransferase family 4 protein [Coriobacteriia bacterium]
MRIVSVHGAAEWGGAERYTRDLLLGLAQRGHDVVLIGKPHGRLFQSLEGTEVRLIGLDLGLTVGWHGRIGALNHPLNWADLYANPRRTGLERVLSALNEERPIDVLHAQHVKEKLWVTSFGHKEGVPVAWTLHAPLEPWMKTSAPGKVHAQMRTRVGGLLAVNRAALQDYLAFGFVARASAVVYNGIDVERYAAGDRGATRRLLGVDDALFVLLVVARPYPGKGIDVLLEALSRGLAQEPDLVEGIRVFVAGESSHVSRYQARLHETGLERVVVFLGHRDDIPDLLSAADAAVLPSLYEGLPYAISEAMAAGRAVIATRVGGIPEMLEDGRSGLLVDPGSPEPLWRAIRLLATSPNLCSSLAQQAKRVAQERFNLRDMIEKSEEFLDLVAMI